MVLEDVAVDEVVAAAEAEHVSVPVIFVANTAEEEAAAVVVAEVDTTILVLHVAMDAVVQVDVVVVVVAVALEDAPVATTARIHGLTAITAHGKIMYIRNT